MWDETGMDEEVARYYRQLRQPGRVNDRVGAAIAVTGTLPETEAPCDLCTLPDRDTIDIVHTDDGGYIAVLNELKGHGMRLLAASHSHGHIPSDRDAYNTALLDETASRIDDGYMLSYGRMGTYHGHWHVVASDLPGDDLEDIHDAALYRVNDGAYEKIWERPEDDRSTTGDFIFYD